MPNTIRLHGRIYLSANIELVTGLHIGGAAGGLEIGGVDKPVIRNPLTDQPYIPGSSIKGKLRSLLEKTYAAPQTFSINEGVHMHVPESAEHYTNYPIACIFGTLPQWGPRDNRKAFTITHPTRLIVRDVPLEESWAKKLRALKTDLPYTEVKWEASIDRVTSAAAPRQIERVPAGAVFGPAEFVFSVYTKPEEQGSEAAVLFGHVIEGLEYLEDDYLGGMGTRGNGRVRFDLLGLTARRILAAGGYGDPQPYDVTGQTVQTLNRDALKTWLRETFA